MPPDSFSVTNYSAAIIGLVTLLTVIWNSRQQRLKEERLRKWEIDDRAVVAAKVADASNALAARVAMTSDVLAIKVTQTAADLAQKVIDTSLSLAHTVTVTGELLQDKVRVLEAAIAENSKLTVEAKQAARDAFVEANHVNNKIAALGLANIAAASDARPPGRRRSTDRASDPEGTS